MPIVDCGFRDAEAGRGGALLEQHGPTLLVDIGFDPGYLLDAPDRPPQPGRRQIPALIDTGANMSCIDDELARELSLPLVDRQFMSGVGGQHEANLYLAQVFAPAVGFTQYGQFFGVNLRAGGQEHQALLGRTFLTSFMFLYDGIRGQVTLMR